MVLTESLKKHKFSKGERVLCFEPDPTKTKVLYDSKVLDVYETKNKRGKKVTQYNIHFQGWSSSWDRRVSSKFVLQNTVENKLLQKELANRAKLCAQLEKKYRINSELEGSHFSSEENNSSCSAFNKNDDFQMKLDSESYNSSVESFHDEHRVMLRTSEKLKRYLEYDQDIIVRNHRQHILPAMTPVITILEKFVKQSAIKLAMSPQNENPRKRNVQSRIDRKEKEFEKLFNTVKILKEVVDGLRIYFDFTLLDHLLYKNERQQACALLSEQYLNNFIYIAVPGLLPDFLIPSIETNSLIKVLEGRGTSTTASCTDRGSSEERQKRKLRSHKVEVDDFDSWVENCFSSILNNGSEAPSLPTQQNQNHNSLSNTMLIQSLSQLNFGIPTYTRDYLQKVLSWQLLPSYTEASPSMIFGATHLARLLVKLPDFLNASTIPDDKFKLLLQHLDSFVNYLESQNEWFGEEQYFKSSYMDSQ